MKKLPCNVSFIYFHQLSRSQKLYEKNKATGFLIYEANCVSSSVWLLTITDIAVNGDHTKVRHCKLAHTFKINLKIYNILFIYYFFKIDKSLE